MTQILRFLFKNHSIYATEIKIVLRYVPSRKLGREAYDSLYIFTYTDIHRHDSLYRHNIEMPTHLYIFIKYIPCHTDVNARVTHRVQTPEIEISGDNRR